MSTLVKPIYRKSLKERARITAVNRIGDLSVAHKREADRSVDKEERAYHMAVARYAGQACRWMRGVTI